MLKPKFLIDSLLEAIFLEVATKWFPWQPQFFFLSRLRRDA